jgi:hypothetical protein
MNIRQIRSLVFMPVLLVIMARLIYAVMEWNADLAVAQAHADWQRKNL